MQEFIFNFQSIWHSDVLKQHILRILLNKTSWFINKLQKHQKIVSLVSMILCLGSPMGDEARCWASSSWGWQLFHADRSDWRRGGEFCQTYPKFSYSGEFFSLFFCHINLNKHHSQFIASNLKYILNLIEVVVFCLFINHIDCPVVAVLSKLWSFGLLDFI